MKNVPASLSFLVVGWALGLRPAQAQHCHPAYHYSSSVHHHRTSSGPPVPYVPKRGAAYFGLLGLADRAGVPYLGLDVAAHYWLLPRWSTGLRGNFTGLMPAPAAADAYPGAKQPRLEQYALTWDNSLLLADRARWRLALQGGAGLGGVGLYDNARGVPARGSCGCTTAAGVASATGLVTEIGLAATHKGKSPGGAWLTLRGGYRQWNGAVPFGETDQFSSYVLSFGLSVPDAPPGRK